MMNYVRSRLQPQPGQSTVEFALLLPAFIAMLATVALLMAFFFQNWGLNRVAEELGNRIITQGSYTTEVRDQMLAYAANYNLNLNSAEDTLSIRICSNDNSCTFADWNPPAEGVSFNYGDRITVSMAHPSDFPLFAFINALTPTAQWAETAQRTGEGIVGGGVFPAPIGVSQAKLTATITDIATSSPITDASAVLTVGGTTRALTHLGSGVYELNNINPPATYTLYVTAPGYKSNSSSVVIGPSDNTANVQMAQPASASITVTDAGGSPLIVSPAVIVNGGTLGARSTDGSGVALFSNITPGTHTFVASANGYASGTLQLTIASAEAATATIALSTASVLSGRICETSASTCDESTPNNRTIPGSIVTWGVCPTGDDPNAVCQTVSGSDGRFSMSVPAGSGTISVSHAGYQSSSESLTVGAGSTTYYISLVEYGFLSGRITDPVTGVSGVNVTIAPVTDPSANTTADTAGYYTSGQYLEPGGTYVATYTRSGYLSTTRSFTAAEGLNRINLVMSKPGILDITVCRPGSPNVSPCPSGRAPVAGYTVSVICTRASCDNGPDPDTFDPTAFSGVSSAGGKVTLSGLIPGRYNITVAGTNYSANVTVRSGPEVTERTVVLP